MAEDGLSVAVAQLAAAPDSHEEALAMLARALERVRGADLLVLPELALCGYGDSARIRRLATPIASLLIDDVRSLARRTGTGVIAGYAERDGETLFNAAVAIGPDGTILGNYRKVNLWGTYERSLFTPGMPSPVIPWGPLKLGLLICYDLEFPEAARDLALRGADTLVVISATSAPHYVVPRALVPARGYETGCHVAFANWSGTDGTFAFIGSSCITAPDGSALAAAPVGEAATIQARISATTVATWRQGHDYIADRRQDVYRLG